MNTVREIIARYRMTRDGRTRLLHACVMPLRYQVDYYRQALADAASKVPAGADPYRAFNPEVARLRRRAGGGLKWFERVLSWVPEEERDLLWYEVRKHAEELGFLVGWYTREER
jgi:hypothetical protein